MLRDIAEWLSLNWDETNAVGTWALVVVTGVLAYGVFFEVGKYRSQQTDQFYSQLDSIYYAIQAHLIEHPYLLKPRAEMTAEQVIQYDAFAFMSWNFVESICDYSEEDKQIEETWSVITLYEANLHREWFLEARNVVKFKPGFRRHVFENIFGIDYPTS